MRCVELVCTWFVNALQLLQIQNQLNEILIFNQFPSVSQTSILVPMNTIALPI